MVQVIICTLISSIGLIFLVIPVSNTIKNVKSQLWMYGQAFLQKYKSILSLQFKRNLEVENVRPVRSYSWQKQAIVIT
jgi:hypothetical protein